MEAINNVLEAWEVTTAELTRLFVRKYFGGDADWYWIGSEVGGTIEVNDCYFSIDDIVDFLRYKYSKKDLFDFYDELSANNFERKASIRHWKHLRKNKKTPAN